MQQEMQLDSTNSELIAREIHYRQEYQRVHHNYISFLRQKAKVRWAEKGDENTRVFHQSIKIRRAHNRVNIIKNDIGEWVSRPKEVTQALLQFYQTLLGSRGETRIITLTIIYKGRALTDEQ